MSGPGKGQKLGLTINPKLPGNQQVQQQLTALALSPGPRLSVEREDPDLPPTVPDPALSPINQNNNNEDRASGVIERGGIADLKVKPSPRDYGKDSPGGFFRGVSALTAYRGRDRDVSLSYSVSSSGSRSRSTASLDFSTIHLHGPPDLVEYYGQAQAMEERDPKEAFDFVFDCLHLSSTIFTHLCRRDFCLYQRVDVLPILTGGTSFLKFSKTGSPHFRLLQLSHDLRFLTYSSPKKARDVSIDLACDTSVVMGQSWHSFSKAPRALAFISFSVLTGMDKKQISRDFIAKDAREFAIWTEGLTELLRCWRNPEEIAALKHLYVKVPYISRDVISSYLAPIRYFCGPLLKLDFFQDMVRQKTPPPALDNSPEFTKIPAFLRGKVEVLSVMSEGTCFVVYHGTEKPRYLRVEVNTQKGLLLLIQPKRDPAQEKETGIKRPKSAGRREKEGSGSRDKDREKDGDVVKATFQLSEITRIQIGQTTQRFTRMEAPRMLAQVSLSILFGSDKESLDLIAHSVDAFELWSCGLAALLRVLKLQRGERARNLQKLIVELALPQGKGRSSQKIKDYLRACVAVKVCPQEYFLPINPVIDPDELNSTAWVDVPEAPDVAPIDVSKYGALEALVSGKNKKGGGNSPTDVNNNTNNNGNLDTIEEQEGGDMSPREDKGEGGGRGGGEEEKEKPQIVGGVSVTLSSADLNSKGELRERYEPFML